ncbi:MAG: hypothetical protein KDA71_06125 [Planctomycetales bacterium]|nr:hypothetical protein [Planctomycetales bacterium]
MSNEPTNGRRNPEQRTPGFNVMLYALIFGIAILFVVFYVMQMSTDEIAYRDLLTLVAEQRVESPTTSSGATAAAMDEDTASPPSDQNGGDEVGDDTASPVAEVSGDEVSGDDRGETPERATGPVKAPPLTANDSRPARPQQPAADGNGIRVKVGSQTFVNYSNVRDLRLGATAIEGVVFRQVVGAPLKEGKDVPFRT